MFDDPFMKTYLDEKMATCFGDMSEERKQAAMQVIPAMLVHGQMLAAGVSPKEVVPSLLSMLDRTAESVGEPLQADHIEGVARVARKVSAVANEVAGLLFEAAVERGGAGRDGVERNDEERK